ncbi:MAG: PorP/SprF family type IX secretion system membrane protein [Bacteroidota bacterium]
MSQKLFLGSLMISCLAVSLSAQDPFFSHFYGNESSFNPAFVGKRGSMSITAKHRMQWGANTAAAYRTSQVTFEESLPCFFLDWGVVATRDEEGEGLLTTNEFGFRTAFFIPTSGRRHSTISSGNLRFGIGLHWGQRTIDYSRLTFLDQIDPTYNLTDADGRPNVSAFNAAGESADTPRYFTPSLGVAWRHIMNRRDDRSWVIDLGLAVHNWGGLVSVDARQTASLLGLDNPLGERWIASAVGEKVVYTRQGRYWAVRPSAVMQWQEGLGYLELGMGLTWQRNATFGMFYHHAKSPDTGQNTNWLSLQFELGFVHPNRKSRFDFGLSYSLQNGPLKNYVNAPLELTARLHLGGRSISCSIAGLEEEGAYKNKQTNCYLFHVSPSRQKIYDNIWYSNTDL